MWQTEGQFYPFIHVQSDLSLRAEMVVDRLYILGQLGSLHGETEEMLLLVFWKMEDLIHGGDEAFGLVTLRKYVKKLKSLTHYLLTGEKLYISVTSL